MKVIITHDQNSIDPSESMTDSDFNQFVEKLENEYSAAITSKYPDAVITFNRQNCSNVSVPECQETQTDVSDICERVFDRLINAA